LSRVSLSRTKLDQSRHSKRRGPTYPALILVSY